LDKKNSNHNYSNEVHLFLIPINLKQCYKKKTIKKLFIFNPTKQAKGYKKKQQ